MVKYPSVDSKRPKSKKVPLKSKHRACKKPASKEHHPFSYADLVESRIMAQCFLAAAINQLQEELVYQPHLENKIADLEDILDQLVNGDFSVNKYMQIIEEECLEFAGNKEEKILCAVEFLNLALGSLYKIASSTASP